MQRSAPQSGQVFGALKPMKEDFHKDIAEMQDSKTQAVEEFKKLKAAKKTRLRRPRRPSCIVIVTLRHCLQQLRGYETLEVTDKQLTKGTKFLQTLHEKRANSHMVGSCD